MKHNLLKEYREKSLEALASERRELEAKLKDLRFRSRTEQIENPRQIRALRRSIAQISTIMHTKQNTKE